MSKELFVSSTPHETKVAVVEEDQLAEIYFERENEYTLAGSIYKGKVTRVLPGMQSAFVEIGLERDAFLYVTDFLEDVESDEDEAPAPAPQAEASEGREDGGERKNREERGSHQERGGRGGRERRGRDRDRGRRPEQHRAAQASELRPAEETEEQVSAEPDGNIVEAGAPATDGSDERQ